MTNTPPVTEALQRQLAGRPSLAARYKDFQAAFADEGKADPRLLALCRIRIDALHGLSIVDSVLGAQLAATVSRGEFGELGDQDQQVLALAEQMVLDAHGVTDKQLQALAGVLGESAVVTLLTAIAMFDSNARMQKVLGSFEIGGPDDRKTSVVEAH